MAIRKNMNQGINFVEFEGATDIRTMPDLYRRNNTAYCIFPNLITPIEPTGFPLLFFWPHGRRRIEMEAVYIALHNFAPIRASLESDAFSGMIINNKERRIYWFHEEIDRRIGQAHVPEGLKVPQLLGGYVEEPLVAAAE